MTYVPWLGSPEHAEAEQVHALLLSVSDEAALDAYNAMKSSYLDKAEAEIERLTRRPPAPTLGVSDMLNRLRAAQHLPYDHDPNTCSSCWGIIAPGVDLVPDDGTPCAHQAPQVVIALAINLLEMDGEQVELDSWPAAQEFILHILNALPKE